MSRFALVAAAVAVTLCGSSALAQAVVSPDPTAAPSGAYKLDPRHTSVVIRLVHMGLSNFAMRFDKVSGAIVWDAADATKSKLDVVIDPASIDTGVPDLDAEVSKALVAKSLSIHFMSTRIEKTGPTTGRITGDLEFNGVTRPVTLDATFNGSRGGPGHRRMGFSASGGFKRSDFGFTQFSQWASDDLKLQIETEASQ